MLRFTSYLNAIFQVQAPGGGLYLKGRFNGGFFVLPVWGAYIWRGLYMEGLIFGILRYISKPGLTIDQNQISLTLSNSTEQK